MSPSTPNAHSRVIAADMISTMAGADKRYGPRHKDYF